MLVNLFGPDTILESDGTHLYPSSQTDLNSQISQATKGRRRFLIIVTITENCSLRFRTIGMRGSGSSVTYTYETVDGRLIFNLVNSALMA